MNYTKYIINVFSPIVNGFFNILYSVIFLIFAAILLFFISFVIMYKVYPKNFNTLYLSKLEVKFKYHDLLRWLLFDLITSSKRLNPFGEYGFTFYVGRQGQGKTVSMVKYLEWCKTTYPRCKVVTNFACIFADYRMETWRDLLEIRNGEDGVIFAIDEIHSEYSSNSWKDFPEVILSEISQQRKQKVKIVATSQVFSRIAKPLREQAFTVVKCFTYFGRFVFNDEYDAEDFAIASDAAVIKKRVKKLSKKSFVQSDYIRACYNTYEKIERMQKLEFIPRNERGSE